MTVLIGAVIAIVALMVGATIMSLMASAKISDMEAMHEQENEGHRRINDTLREEIRQMEKVLHLDPDPEPESDEYIHYETPRTIDFRWFMFRLRHVDLKCIKAPYDPVVYITAKHMDFDYLIYEESVSLEEFALCRERILTKACREILQKTE